MACLVLAAGKGARFGLKKQLVTIDGQPMINRVLLELKPITSTIEPAALVARKHGRETALVAPTLLDQPPGGGELSTQLA